MRHANDPSRIDVSDQALNISMIGKEDGLAR